MEIAYAVLATFGISLAGLFYRDFARNLTPLWMNAYKIITGLTCFFVLLLFENGTNLHFPQLIPFGVLALSGILGLLICDWLLIYAYSTIGVGHTQLLFRFQPLIVTVMSIPFFAQVLNISQWTAVLLFILCILLIRNNDLDAQKSWGWLGVVAATGAVLLDSAAILVTKYSFNLDPSITVTEVNLYRSAGAAFGLGVIRVYRPIGLRARFTQLSLRAKAYVTAGSIIGTFASLYLWTKAISMGNLAVVTAIGGIGPLFAIPIEAIFDRKVPTKRTFIALALSLVAFFLLLR
jgi:drug/metabolite transporter (DMT)-like permease